MKVSYGLICRESFNLLCVDNLSYFVYGQMRNIFRKKAIVEQMGIHPEHF